MAEHTKNECASSCRVPYSCCSSYYCELAEQNAKCKGLTLPQTGHPTLPFMGINGCTVPPHLRPLCTLHVCSINSLGFKPNDQQWTSEYFALRRQLEKRDQEWDPERDGTQVHI